MQVVQSICALMMMNTCVAVMGSVYKVSAYVMLHFMESLARRVAVRLDAQVKVFVDRMDNVSVNPVLKVLDVK
jgi:hypothetical protein